MEKIKVHWEFLCLGLGTALGFILLLLNFAVGGISADVSALQLVGREFICEWVSPDGKEAILVTDGGCRRFVHETTHGIGVGCRVVKLGPLQHGQRYRLRTKTVARWVNQSYLFKI